MTRKEMMNERAQSDARINSAERGGFGRSQIESLFKTHYTQMYHLSLPKCVAAQTGERTLCTLAYRGC